MQVLKFGGTSVANAANINKVIAIIRQSLKKDKTAVVFSAIGGCTDKLIAIGRCAVKQDKDYLTLIDELQGRHIELIDKLIPEEESAEIKAECRKLFGDLSDICNGVFLLKELTPLSLDHIQCFGELLSTMIISAKLKSMNIEHTWKDSRELIKTESIAGKNAIIGDVTEKNIKEYFNSSQHHLYILPGFIAMDMFGRTTTLGRGGSDYTASIIAVGATARRLEIWTDVCGMMTADPRIVPHASTIRNISYKEALELSHFGAKVVYPPTIQPVVKQGIPIYVKNTFEPDDPGTLIERNPPEGNNNIKGISSSDKIALLSMEGSGMVGIPGYSSKLFDTLSKNNINIILITQASSVHTMCIAIDEKDAERAKRAADELFAYEISLGKVDPLRVEKGFSIISLVGDDMKNQSGASGKMFEALGYKGISIRAIAQGSSEKNVSAVVRTEDVNEAIRAIHNEFFTGKANRINLFIAGFGSVAKALVEIIHKNREAVRERSGKELVICGLSNSKKFIIEKEGIDLSGCSCEKDLHGRIAELLEAGHDNSGGEYINALASFHIGDSVFVDCTASKSTAASYITLFRAKYSITACNKIACSGSQDAYDELLANAVKEGVKFRYETTVCAALPVLAVIEHLVNTGDKIESMQGILSGTLNWLFSNYTGEVSFADLVKRARDLGYTEPDPRVDLSGTDVLRKLIIFSRTAGIRLERSDIEFNGFIPEDILCRENGPEQFCKKLQEWDGELKRIYEQAAQEGKKLRFIASSNNGRYRIALEKIDSSHPFFNVNGSDNAFVIKSLRYPQGIVIKGAGAGAHQTAGGVLNDILSI